jgi:hypothetical protein
MSPYRFGLLLVLLAASVAGCAVHEMHKDQDLIRGALLDLYTNQIMDNLVRAANGLPIIQLDYTQAQANVTIKNTVAGSENQATTGSRVLMIPATALSTTRTVVTTLIGGLANENSNQVSVAANPVTTSNEVYDAYLEYLTLPGSLVVTCQAPNPGQAHICKKYDGKYYWVPMSYKGYFFRLALLTTARRGKALLPAEEYFQVTLTDIVKEEPNRSNPANFTYFTYKLNKKIPRDDGYIVFDKLPEEQESLTQQDFQASDSTTGSETDLIALSVNNNNLDAYRKLPRTAKIYLEHKRPKPPTTDDLINRVNFNLQQIQFNQLRGTDP